MKNLELKLDEKFKAYVVSRRPFDEPLTNKRGIQYRIYFPDVRYGASVIKHYGSYGYEDDLWELALLKFKEGGWRLEYDGIVGDDVLGCLTDEQVNVLLESISKGEVTQYIEFEDEE